MDKNWLIRTKSNHILGPVSKDKVIELINNNSLKSDDELCSANGYWFFVKEKQLIEKYILGNEQQTFNPISEARDVVSVQSVKKSQPPSPTNSISDDTKVSKDLDISSFQTNSVEEAPKKKALKVTKTPTTSPVKGHYKDSKTLHFLLISLFVLLISTLYFRKIIIKKFSFNPFHLIINQAHAEEEVKKKSFLSH